MKKIIAVLLAMLLLATAALAETAIIADPYFEVTADGETQSFDLKGLNIKVTTGEVGEGKTAVGLIVEKDGQVVLQAAANLVDDKAYFALDGVDGVFFVEVPEQVEEVKEDIDLSNINLNIDAAQLVSTLMTSIEFTENGFRLPYTAINEILKQIAPAIKEANIPDVDADEFEKTVDQLIASNTGLTLEGSFISDEQGMSGSLNAINVENGEEKEQLATATFGLTEEAFNCEMEVVDLGKLGIILEPSPANEGYLYFVMTAADQTNDYYMSMLVGSDEEGEELRELDTEGAVDIANADPEVQEAFANDLDNALGDLADLLMGEEAA